MGQTGVELHDKCPLTLKPVIERRLKGQPYTFSYRLVGTKCTAKVSIAEQKVSCLLETASQVTTVTLSFYQRFLKEQQIKPLHDLLEVEGANGQEVPYFWYVELDISFPKEFVGQEIEIPMLALVVPNMRGEAQEQLLIGTNTLDVLYSVLTPQIDDFNLPVQCGYKAVLKVLEIRHKHGLNGNLGAVKLLGKDPELIPAGSTIAFKVRIGS